MNSIFDKPLDWNRTTSRY